MGSEIPPPKWEVARASATEGVNGVSTDPLNGLRREPPWGSNGL